MAKDEQKFQEYSVEELKKKLSKSRAELMELHFQKAAQQLRNFQKIKQSRREIAQILTALNKKEK
jgi:ribosomal protein L29